jgi:hypothetical protein
MKYRGVPERSKFFFGTYACARFDSLMVMYGMNRSGMKTEIEKALAYLVRRKVLQECIENNTHLFSLTDDEHVLRQALEIVMTAGNLWQSGLKNCESSGKMGHNRDIS